MLETLHHGIRWIHIGFGFVGLAAFWGPVFAKKGGPWHVRCGKVFVFCGYVVGLTALATSLWALADPLSFFSNANPTPEQLAAGAAEIRFFFGILACLSLLLLSAIENGLGVIRTRHEPDRPNPRRRIACALVGLGGALLLAAGAWGLLANDDSREYVRIGLGALLVVGARSRWQHILDPRPTPMTWWYRHMQGMLGAGIAFHTAFAVFGSNRIFHFQLEGPWALVPWVLPPMIGIAGTNIWVRYYQRKFGKRRPSPPSAQQVEA